MDLRAAVIEEFAHSQTIVRDGVDVVPRFRIFAPDGEHVAFVQLPDDIEDRLKRLDVMRQFMVWKAASGFLLSSELIVPNALLVAAVTRGGVAGAIQAIEREPEISFGEIEWLDPKMLDETIVGLLPPKTLEVSREDLAFMRQAFEDGAVEGISWQGPGS